MTKGYRLLDVKTNKLVVSRDVIFDEKTTWNWEDKKIENTAIISSNQEEDEKDEDVSQWEKSQIQIMKNRLQEEQKC